MPSVPSYDPCILMLEAQDGRARMFICSDPVTFQELIAGGRVLELTLSTVFLDTNRKLTSRPLTNLSLPTKLPELFEVGSQYASKWLERAEGMRSATMGPGYMEAS